MNALEKLGISIPLIQAPMAGVSTPKMAAAVSNAGALGSIALGAGDSVQAAQMIAELRLQTDRPFGVNLFVHTEPERDPAREAAWIEWLRPLFGEFLAEPPASLNRPYTSFSEDKEMLALLLEVKPPVISFHFGLPPASAIRQLKESGALLLATATSLSEAKAIERAGIDMIVAQGIEAGGHRGMFDPPAPDDCLGTLALTRLLAKQSGKPVIAAGGIMDGAGIAAALDLGAVAAQLGTAFIACPESSADDGYLKALAGEGAKHTRFVTAISGRPARCLPNRFTALAEASQEHRPPDYPIAYSAGKALNAAARKQGETGFGAHWAGQGAPLARSLPAARLVELLAEELRLARGR